MPTQQGRRHFLRLFGGVALMALAQPFLGDAHAGKKGSSRKKKTSTAASPDELRAEGSVGEEGAHFYDLLIGKLPHERASDHASAAGSEPSQRERVLRKLLRCLRDEVRSCEDVNDDLKEMLSGLDLDALKTAFEKHAKQQDKSGSQQAKKHRIQEPDNDDKIAQNIMALLGLKPAGGKEPGDPGWKMFGETPEEAGRRVTVVEGEGGTGLAVRFRLKERLQVETRAGPLVIVGFCLPILPNQCGVKALKALTEQTKALVLPAEAGVAGRVGLRVPLDVNGQLDALAHKFAQILAEGDCGTLGSQVITKMVGGLVGERKLSKSCGVFERARAVFSFVVGN